MQINSTVMSLYNLNGVLYLRYNSLEKISFINHAFSTKHGGVSDGCFESMNLSFGRGDPDENVTQNYKIFCKAAGFDYESLVASSQDHHTFVRKVGKEQCGIGIYKPKDMQSVDGLITNEPGVTLVTYYADCTPLYFVDVENKAIGLAHSGWRGTVGKIGKNVIEKMKLEFNTNPKNIICAVGPAISKCCYEVDEPVAKKFRENFNSTDNILFHTHDDKYMLDLLQANKTILLECGVPEKNITVSDVCTNCRNDLLWSHRTLGNNRGGLCAFMCIK